MQRTTDLIRALEHHRAQTLVQRQPQPSKPSLPLLLSWIHHDNMLEGRRFRTEEIAQALRDEDTEVVKYLRPLMARIRRYRDAIMLVWNASHDGSRRIRVDTLKRIHRMITPDPKDRGGEFRVSSPVHRDYFQRICSADKVPYNLRRVLEFIQDEFDVACDPIHFAATAHHRLMHVYPFRRNPGVTIRLFTNLVLMSRGYPPAIIPAHRRDAYYHALNHPEPDQLAAVFSEAVSVLLERSGTPLGLIEAPA